MQFIKNNIQIPAIEFDTNIEIIEPNNNSSSLDTTIINNKIIKLLSNFKNINSLLKNINKNNYIDDNDIFIYCTKYIDETDDKFNYEFINKFINNEMNNIDKNGIYSRNSKDNHLFIFLNQFINLEIKFNFSFNNLKNY